METTWRKHAAVSTLSVAALLLLLPQSASGNAANANEAVSWCRRYIENVCTTAQDRSAGVLECAISKARANVQISSASGGAECMGALIRLYPDRLSGRSVSGYSTPCPGCGGVPGGGGAGGALPPGAGGLPGGL
jgi:hypothetical protein